MDVYGRKRTSVIFVKTTDMEHRNELIKVIREQHLRTDMPQDDHPLWCKVSQSPEERARTMRIRCAARACYQAMEALTVRTGYEPPGGFCVDYFRQEIVVDDTLLIRISDDDWTWNQQGWHAKMMDVDMKEVRKQAETIMNATE